MHQNRIIGQSGTTIYFAHGHATPWNGSSGTPWTNPSTTPIRIGMNEVTGQLWTPQESAPTDVYMGDLPVPRSYTSYPRVIDSIPLQIYATNHNAAVAVLRVLKNELRSVAYRIPAVLVFQPDGATNPIYAEIYSARFEINPLFINNENGRNILRCVMYIERSPFFVLRGSISTLFDTTWNNGSTQAYISDQRGDLTYEGQPINLELTPLGGTRIASLFLASCKTPITTTTGAGSKTVGNSTITISLSSNPWHNDYRLRMRVLQRYTGISNATVQIYVEGVGYSDRITIASGSRLIDFGDFPTTILRDSINPRLSITLHVLAGSLTLAETLFIPYYDWASISDIPSQNGEIITLSSFVQQLSMARIALPLLAPTAFLLRSDGTNYTNIPLRIVGSAPRLYPDARLFIAWHTSATSYSTSNQLTLFSGYSPLYLSYRGAQ